MGDRFPDNDVKKGPGGGFTDSRSGLLIAVNLGAGQVWFRWNFRLFRLLSAMKINSGVFALLALPPVGHL